MNEGYFIGQGDKTTCGGKVLDGDGAIGAQAVSDFARLLGGLVDAITGGGDLVAFKKGLGEGL